VALERIALESLTGRISTNCDVPRSCLGYVPGAVDRERRPAFGGDQSSTTPASIRAQPKREIAVEGEHFAKIECRSPERGAYGIAGHITYARRVYVM